MSVAAIASPVCSDAAKATSCCEVSVSLTSRAVAISIRVSPGDTGPARFERRMTDPVWDGLYRPIAFLVDAAATRLNRLQFLTIRRYLSLVFLLLVLLLLVLALWQ